MPTDASRQALAILRDGSQLQWYVIPLLALVIYAYASEIERRNWNVVLAGLAFYALEWLIEIGNALTLHFTNYAALWTAPGKTAFLLLVGLNIEISFMFALAGMGFAKLLPRDPQLKIMGIPNRWLFIVANSVLCVLVEVLLNRAGLLIWAYPFWNFPNIWLIVLIGYMPYMILAFWVYDHPHPPTTVRVIVALYLLDAVLLLLFAGLLKWI